MLKILVAAFVCGLVPTLCFGKITLHCDTLSAVDFYADRIEHVPETLTGGTGNFWIQIDAKGVEAPYYEIYLRQSNISANDQTISGKGSYGLYPYFIYIHCGTTAERECEVQIARSIMDSILIVQAKCPMPSDLNFQTLGYTRSRRPSTR